MIDVTFRTVAAGQSFIAHTTNQPLLAAAQLSSPQKAVQARPKSGIACGFAAFARDLCHLLVVGTLRRGNICSSANKRHRYRNIYTGGELRKEAVPYCTCAWDHGMDRKRSMTGTALLRFLLTDLLTKKMSCFYKLKTPKHDDTAIFSLWIMH
uniref:Uncharacterized protein n=1 Tax=Trichuris muris TaxID=70415 RepID=A0A5S6QN03_TRIMR